MIDVMRRMDDQMRWTICGVVSYYDDAVTVGCTHAESMTLALPLPVSLDAVDILKEEFWRMGWRKITFDPRENKLFLDGYYVTRE